MSAIVRKFNVNANRNPVADLKSEIHFSDFFSRTIKLARKINEILILSLSDAQNTEGKNALISLKRNS